MARSDQVFDGNDYRKRVLAAIEARGGAQTSDPFEWYDVPLDAAETIRDRVVAEQVAAVWAFWQKQRDHPKYRGLVTALLAVHHEASAEICDPTSRKRLALETRLVRTERDEARFGELDGAIERLVERFGGIPRSKLEGLRAFAVQAGVDPGSVESRLNRHRVVDDAPVPARPPAVTVSPAVYRQIRADLDELGRILGRPAPVSLYDLLGLAPGAPLAEVSQERDLAMAQNRELRPDRRRALVDDLLAAVTSVLLEGDPDAYLDALAEEVTGRLRTRVAAAVLVEDLLTEADHEHLVGEAEALGLDRGRAARVLASLAGELGVAVPTLRAPSRTGPSSSVPSSPGSEGPQTPPGRTGSWHETLSQARAALRAGRVLEARSFVAEARHLAGGTLPPIRAVSDEIDEVLTEAYQLWRAAVQSLAALRYTEASHALERIAKIAVDVAGPTGQSVTVALAEARAGSDRTVTALAAAEALSGDDRELALLAALQTAPDHPGLLAALQACGVKPARAVQVRVSGRFVVVSWARSGSPGSVAYRVEHVDADGERKVLGTTQSTELEAALPPGAGPGSTYLVVARRAGIASVEAAGSLSGPPASQPQPAVAAPASADPGPVPSPIPSLVLLPHGRRVRLVYPAPPTGRAEVRRLPQGVAPPAAGSLVADPSAYGELVPGMGPGLAVDRKPSAATGYVVFTLDPELDRRAVAGASTWFVELPPVTGLRHEDGRLRWGWPPGCTEVMVLWRPDAAPERVGDPAAVARKLTNTRYQIDDGLALPEERPLHVAVFACTRAGGALATASEAPPGARLTLPGPGLPEEG